MSNQLEHIIRTTIKDVLSEQETQQQNSDIQSNVFTEPQQKFLGSFANAGSQHLGIIYSISEIGIREFVARSGVQYNCTPAVLISLIRGKYIKVIPYTGYGRDTDYTIELQLPLDSVQSFAAIAAAKPGETDGAAGPADTSTSSGGGGGMPSMGGDDLGGDDLGGDIPGAEGAPGEPPPVEGEEAIEPEEEPPIEVAHVVKYGDLLKESIKISKQLMNEASKSKKKVLK